MVKIITSGREDLKDLWEKSNILDQFKREHHPFLVFIELEDGIEVEIVKTIDRLLSLNNPETTRIMVQWEGNWRSNFFHFSLKELREAYYKKHPQISTEDMEKYYELYHKETGKEAIRGGTETKIFQRWYHHKREMEKLNKSLNKESD